MAMQVEGRHTEVARRIDHRVFHADEDRELDARLAELNGTREPLPSWAGADHALPAGREGLDLVFGVYGLI